MPSTAVSRRQILRAGPVALVGLAGCLSQPGATAPSTGSPVRSPTTRRPNAETSDTGETSVASVDVADFVRYPLAGNHPHVHRRVDTQYVIVRLMTPKSRDTVRDRLSLALNDASLPLAERQPVPWNRETVDLAFAVPKTERFDQGRVVFERAELRTLSEPVLSRLNNPPVFEVSNISVAPSEIRAAERRTARVQFDLANTGAGRGTFGASLNGNFLSGSKTVTAVLDSGGRREVAASTEIVGGGTDPTVRLDWGSDEWATSIPVVGTTNTIEPSIETSSS